MLALFVNIGKFINGSFKLWEALVSVVFAGVYLHMIERLRSTTSASKLTANPIRVDSFWAFIRKAYLMLGTIGGLLSLLGIFMSKYTFDNFLLDMWIIFKVCMFYFMACTPRPWSKARAGKLVDGLAHFLFGKLVPQAN